jgi:hypothetical protein
MTQFTSFVAVEEMVVTDGGKPRRIDVPVEVPEGVNGKDFDGAASAPTGTFGYIGFSSRATAVAGNFRVRGKIDGLRNAPSPPNAAPMVSSISTTLPETIATDPRQVPVQPGSEFQVKLHRSVLAVVQKLQKREMVLTSGEFEFIRDDGKADLQVWLTDKSDETLAQLKELGFEVVIDAKSSKFIIGRLPMAKLEALAKLKAVKYVSPQVMK